MQRLMLLFALSLLALPAAGQATITVNNTADADPSASGDGSCTLREAITNANANNDATGGDCASGVGSADTIAFNINGGGSLATIQPMSTLPAITEAMMIDGTTQGCAGGGPCIELDGNNFSGLLISSGASNNTIGGTTTEARNVISGNFNGIQLSGIGTTGNTVAGNYIGTDVTGNAAGVHITSDASNNTVGGTDPGARNVISGNTFEGVRISSSGGNTIAGNYIGTDVTGAVALGNRDGVMITTPSTNNMVGGTTAVARNVISGNGEDGVRFISFGATNNTIAGNYIGTDAAGTAALSRYRPDQRCV